MTCSECYRPAKARGRCATHYEYWRRRQTGLGTTLKGAERFWSLVNKTESCWLYLGNLGDKGYGRFGKPPHMAHRYAYELLVGPIPPEMTADHLCRVRNCVNPEHLEIVTRGENTARSRAVVNAGKTQCPKGHPYGAENTRVYQGSRHCRECDRARNRARRAKLRAVAS